MKQPQLGKKISELRLGKGLTQTELAEQCNLSLRTIQRIETAKVTPRSYSIKLIFKNLDCDAYNSTNENTKTNVSNLLGLKINTIKKSIILLLLMGVITWAYFVLHPKKKIQSPTEVTKIIKASQMRIKKWMNTGQVDSVMTLYRKDACWLNSICGKVEIGARLQSITDNGYDLIEYKTLSISIGDTIAVEKYQNRYKYKGNTKEQFGIVEWRLTNGTWLIVNDVFND